jgi:hypothetical protein
MSLTECQVSRTRHGEQHVLVRQIELTKVQVGTPMMHMRLVK